MLLAEALRERADALGLANNTGHNATGHTPPCALGAGGGSQRPWLMGWGVPTDLLTWGVAALSALPITFFFFMDQNISSLLCQLPSQLPHPPYAADDGIQLVGDDRDEAGIDAAEQEDEDGAKVCLV